MGLRPLPEGEWLDVDAHRAEQLAYKAQLLVDHPDQVLAVVEDPEGRIVAACQELVDRVRGQLHRLGVDDAGSERIDAARHPIDVAGRLTQEDWCVHLPDEAGDWRLVAASVCFPTRWDLRTKIGRTVRQIHGPVPAYEQQLAAPVDAAFARMRPERGVWRLNWNLLDDPDLHQPSHDRHPLEVSAETAGDRLWLRVERQTLVKLPDSAAIVFGIRVLQDPLASLAGDSLGLERLRDGLLAMPRPTLVDKGLDRSVTSVLEWIRRQLSA